MSNQEFVALANNLLLKWCEHHAGMENVDDETLRKLVEVARRFSRAIEASYGVRT